MKALGLLYFPFHGIELAELFEYYGPLAFVSAAVYQVDEANELSHGAAQTLDMIAAYLQRSGFLDERIENYIRDGNRYLQIEWSSRTRPIESSRMLASAMSWRSSDFRILHCMIHQLRGIAYDQRVFEAFAQFEFVMEIEDDLGSLWKDHAAQSFNFICHLRSLHGSDISQVFEDTRADALRRLGACRQKLPEPQRTRLSDLFENYRVLVPEPDLTAILATTRSEPAAISK